MNFVAMHVPHLKGLLTRLLDVISARDHVTRTNVLVSDAEAEAILAVGTG